VGRTAPPDGPDYSCAVSRTYRKKFAVWRKRDAINALVGLEYARDFPAAAILAGQAITLCSFLHVSGL
jgi:hypothetical protein